jgi:hypothetical protein
MRGLVTFSLLAAVAFAQAVVPADAPRLPNADAIRIREFYRLRTEIADRVWPNWASTPAPLLLITGETEFLTHYPEAPNDFKKIADDLYERPRRFSPNLMATFPAFGPTSVIVIGDPEHTEARTSTPWLMSLMHEHFHQLQDNQSGFFEALQNLGLAHGDETGMWMLNFPFPYEKPNLVRNFAQLRDLLLSALNEPDDTKFRALAQRYITERKKFFGQVSTDESKYMSFQLWREGIARYVQVKSAEATAHYQPTPEYAALNDYESFERHAAKARSDTLDEMEHADLASQKRLVFYPLGACEGFLLDRFNPKWKNEYFRKLFALDPYFEN